jgi:hypothetical protein
METSRMSQSQPYVAGSQLNTRLKGLQRSTSMNTDTDADEAKSDVRNEDLAPAGSSRGGGSIAFQQAETALAKPAVFTNCGKSGRQETPAKPGKRKLTRVPFTVSRLMEFCTRRELINQTGHDVSEWPLVVLKELTDNALDECEEAGIAPEIQIEVNGDGIVIADNGRGIPAKTIERVLDYSIRVSSREAYVSPTRGAQGNALKTILPMGYVLDERRGEDACGETVIEAHGLAHHIKFSVDHLRQEPKIEHMTRPSRVTMGTKIAVELPGFEFGPQWVLDIRKERFLTLAESYTWLNPHLSLRVVWHGAVKINVMASNPTWAKWLPSWPTSPHWYDKSRFRRYMAAHIANRGEITVREFVREFAGMSATAKQKAVLADTGASYVSLHDFFGRHKANGDNYLEAAVRATAAYQAGEACPSRDHRKGALVSHHGGSWRRSQNLHLQSQLRRDRRRPAHRRVRLRHPPRWPDPRWLRAKPQVHQRRELVARH